MQDNDNFHIIPSIKKIKDLPAALDSLARYILIGGLDIGVLQDSIEALHARNKIVFVNPELVGGLEPSQTGVSLLRRHFNVDGIMSHSTQQLRNAKKEKMLCIQRIFLMDSHYWDTGIKAVNDARVDGIEILPSFMAIKFARSVQKKGLPLFTGGFIKTREDVQKFKASGFAGLTTSAKELWNYIAP